MDAKRREELESQLSAYIDGELTESERAEVEAFLADDAEARQLLAELRATVAGLQNLPRSKASGDLMADVRTRLERQALLGGIQQTETATPVTPSFGRRWIAAAAVVVLAIVAGSVMWTFNNQDTYHGRQRFAMHKQAKPPMQGGVSVQEESKERATKETLLADASQAPAEDKDETQAAAQPMLLADAKADADHASDKGQTLSPVDRGRETEPPAPLTITQAPSEKLPAELPESEGRSMGAGASKDTGAIYEIPTVDIESHESFRVGDEHMMVARKEAKTQRVSRRATFEPHLASQPQFAVQPQDQAKQGRYLANRPVRLPARLQDTGGRFVYDLEQPSASQPTTHPASRPATTRPCRASQTRPVEPPTSIDIGSLSAPKPKSAPSR